MNKSDNKGMKGIVNSDLDPLQLLNDLGQAAFAQALNEPDYLIALLQRAFFVNVRYNPDDERFADITPNKFRATMSEALRGLEQDVWHALARAELTCAAAGFTPGASSKEKGDDDKCK